MKNLKYNPLGNPKLAKHIKDTLNENGLKTHLNQTQGLDHGVWIPLRIMFPDADIPILQLSIPIPRTPEDLFKIGSLLREYRTQNIMFMGSRNIVHNLPYVFNNMLQGIINLDNWSSTPVDTWAMEIDEWIRENLDGGNNMKILEAPQKAPNFQYAAPTTEHFDPFTW